MAPEDRKIPISLRGIETILHVMYRTLREPSSMRQISLESDLSMRVTKNVLLELENLHQVKQVIEPGQKLAKWELTSLGEQIAQAIEPSTNAPDLTQAEKLLANVIIPKKLDEINSKISSTHNSIRDQLQQVQLDLSKTMGVCYSNDYQIIAEKIGQIINKFKLFLREINELRANPLIAFNIKKRTTQKNLSNREKRTLLVEMVLVNQLLFNQIRLVRNLTTQLSEQIERGVGSNLEQFSQISLFFDNIYNQIRILNGLIDKRKILKSNLNTLSENDIQRVRKNQITLAIINQFLPETIPLEQRQEVIQKQIINFIDNSTNDEKSKNLIPLYAFYSQFNEFNQYSSITLAEFEQALQKLAQQGVIVGLKTIRDGGDDEYKVIQISTQDLMAEEIQILRFALEQKSFSKSEIIEQFGWNQKKTKKILTILTENGLLRYSKSYLHGEKWYLVI